MKYYFRCPKCGNDEQFVTPSEETSDLGCALLVFGGFIPALIFADHNRRRIQCTRCAHIFRQPRIPSGPLATFADWILILTILPVGIALFFFCFTELSELLPSNLVIAPIEEAIAREPRVAAYLLGLLFILILVSSCVTGWLSNRKFRKQLSTEYRLKPLSSRELAEQHSPPAHENADG